MLRRDGVHAQMDIGTLRVGAAQLQAALLPVPRRLMAELHERLPAMAAVRYSALSDAIHEAASRLLRRPAAVDEAVERLSFLADVQVLPRHRMSLLTLRAPRTPFAGWPARAAARSGKAFEPGGVARQSLKQGAACRHAGPRSSGSTRRRRPCMSWSRRPACPSAAWRPPRCPRCPRTGPPCGPPSAQPRPGASRRSWPASWSWTRVCARRACAGPGACSVTGMRLTTRRSRRRRRGGRRGGQRHPGGRRGRRAAARDGGRCRLPRAPGRPGRPPRSLPG